MQKNIRVSVVQAAAEAFDLHKTLDKLETLTRLAKERDNAQLVVFPEAFLGGYPKMSSFEVVCGNRGPPGRDEYLRYHSGALSIPSPELSRIEAISRECNVFLVVGAIEKEGADDARELLGTCYCTAVFVDPEQGYIGKHRKILPTAFERVIWGQAEPGVKNLPVHTKTFNSSDGVDKVEAKISATICWENYMPLLRTYYYSQGTQIYCAPTIDARPEWQHSMRHIALEGRCFVLSACQFAQEKHYPPDHPVADPNARNPENVVIAGGSVIINPLGKVLAGPLLGEEGILSATIDLNDCVRGKFDLDVVGHYSRPDIFQLNVRQE